MQITLDLTPEQEKILLTIASKIRGSYGGRKKAENRMKPAKKAGNNRVVSQAA
jgi:hypothetical protein